MKLLTSDEIYKKIEDIVNDAKKSLKIASAWIKGRYFEEILEKAKAKSLKAEIIIRASELKDFIITDDKVFRKAKEIDAKIYLSNRLHTKFILVDDEKAVIGSANFTEAGLSDFSRGNIEAGVYYDNSDSPDEINKLVNYFEEIKRNSVSFDKDLIGFTLNPVKSETFEFILLDESIEENSYVEIRLSDNENILAKVSSIYAYDTGFFANPFSSSVESIVFAPFDDFKKIFSSNKDIDWIKASIYAYLNSNGNKVRIATAKVLGVLKGEKLDLPLKPFDVGTAVYRGSKERIEKLMSKKISGENMLLPIRIGKLKNSDIDVMIDGEEVITKHLFVVGTTGSGKSYFTKQFICSLVKGNEKLQVFIFDPHGEYYDKLTEICNEDYILEIKFDDTLFFTDSDELKELIESLGYGNLVKGNSNVAKKISSYLQKMVKPSLRITKLGEKNLIEILEGIKAIPDNEIRPMHNVINELINDARNTYGENILSNQKETYENMIEGINSDKRIVIFNLKNITDPQTRVNITGLVMQELFNKAKEDNKDRLIVLEEAHNFAPEKGYGDVSAGKDNLSLVMARKIASEGRKFRLGLLTITQRPAQVSKYVISQMNTQVMFRTINKNDLDVISTYVEYAGADTINMLPSLPTGICVISGIGATFPMVVEIK